MPNNTELYERDFFEWTQQTAHLLRSTECLNGSIDVRAVAEEIESLGKSDRRQVQNRLRVLVIHLLKWQMQPERQSGSWEATIVEQRTRLQTVLDDSPSLRTTLEQTLENVYPVACQQATKQMLLFRNPFPASCPWTVQQILDSRFLPGENK